MKADETLLQALKKAFSIGKIYGQVFEGIDSTDQTAAESKKLEFERLCEATIRNLSSCDLQHSDDEAVDKFAQAMKQKLAQAREKGRSGWEQMNPADLSSMLREHVEKGDPRDVANFCMFLWSLGHAIEAVKPADADESMWCRYIAGMIGQYIGEPLGSEKEKAIAGIIERRLWNLPKKEAPAAAINEQLLEVSGKVYELCLSGKFYEDHDKSTGLLGELRAAIRAAKAEKARGPCDGRFY